MVNSPERISPSLLTVYIEVSVISLSAGSLLVTSSISITLRSSSSVCVSTAALETIFYHWFLSCLFSTITVIRFC